MLGVVVERAIHGMSKHRGEVVDSRRLVERQRGENAPAFLFENHPQPELGPAPTVAGDRPNVRLPQISSTCNNRRSLDFTKAEPLPRCSSVRRGGMAVLP